MVPCNSINTESGIMEGENGVVREDCETSLDEQKRYMGQSNILIYANQVHFKQEKFGADSIERYSSIVNYIFDAEKPSWLDTALQFNELQDESGFMQLGYDETYEFLVH